jgi:hypothetical protein
MSNVSEILARLSPEQRAELTRELGGQTKRESKPKPKVAPKEIEHAYMTITLKPKRDITIDQEHADRYYCGGCRRMLTPPEAIAHASSSHCHQEAFAYWPEGLKVKKVGYSEKKQTVPQSQQVREIIDLIGFDV